jgi:23S rRNA (uracil1939-C5)-methyltransferase
VDADRQERPLRAGDVVTGAVADAGEREALVAVPGGTVRVRGVVPGDRVRVRVTHVGQNSAWGELDALVTPSPERVVPCCDRIALCGGCPWQAWEPVAQRREKARRLAAALAPLGPLPIASVLAPEGPPYGHRNKLLLAAGGRRGALSFGLFAPRTHDVVPGEGCVVHDPLGEVALQAVRAALDAALLPPWDEATGRGVLRHVLVRVAPGTGQIGVTLIVARWPLRDGAALGRRLLHIPGVVSVWANHNPVATSVALGPTSARLAGRPRLRAQVGAATYFLTPTGFFQTSTPALPLLVGAALAALPPALDHVVDLYAGAGLFSLALAPRAAHVTAVEASATAVADLRAAARRAGYGHVEGVAEDAVTAPLPAGPVDAVVVDPPRAGLPAAVLARLADLAPRRLVYVSCAPRTLARDLHALVAAGWRVTAIRPVDLFPHTPHLETVAALER